jgi:putative membrane protein (TIGR04086 family)
MEKGKKSIYLIWSLIISYIVTGIILCMLAFFMYQTKAGIGIAGIGITVTYVIASMLAGIITGKQVAKKKFLWGMLSGLLYFLILVGISFLVHENPSVFSGQRLTVLLLCGAGGMLGGMIS